MRSSTRRNSWLGWRVGCPATSFPSGSSSGRRCRSPVTARSPRRLCARSWRRAGSCRLISRARLRPSKPKIRAAHPSLRRGSGALLSRSEGRMHTNGTALVTGGASGIGLAIVRSLLEEGWHVMVADLAQTNLDQARQELGGDAERIRFESLDVTDEEG